MNEKHEKNENIEISENEETKDNHITILNGIHMTFMFLLGIMSFVAISGLVSGEIFQDETLHERFPKTIMLGIGVMGVNIAALLSGILYILKGCTKKAALYYKVFLVLSAVSGIMTAAASAFRIIEASQEGEQIAVHLALTAILPMAVKTILLLVLAFRKNLGKSVSWIIFGIILAIDLIYSPLWISPASLAVVRVTMTLSRLIMTVTIGMAIRSKYADKKERGTV